MQWLGSAILALALILALSGRISIIAFGAGAGLLAVWYLFGREERHVPPDESDFITADVTPERMTEASTSFDLHDFHPFLAQLGRRFESGLAEKTIHHIAELAARMKHDEERTLRYEIMYQGVRAPLEIGLFKDDEEEITAYFHTVPQVASLIDAEMESFFSERGQ